MAIFSNVVQNLTFMDDIFASFISSNKQKGKSFSLGEMLSIDIPCTFSYTYQDTPYLAELFTSHNWDNDVLHMKLHNDKKMFDCMYIVLTLYIKFPLESEPYSQSTELMLQCFPNLVDILHSTNLQYASVRVYFDSKSNVLEVRIFPKENNNLPIMCLTYEYGHPLEIIKKTNKNTIQ